MEILPLVPAPVVVLPVVVLPVVVGCETDDGVGEGAAATEVLSEQVGAASASGKTDKRESAVENIIEVEKRKGE